MKNKLLIYAIFPMLGLGILGANMASAHGLFGGFGGISNMMTPDQIVTRQQDMFQSEAALLGISVDEVKNGWAEGKNLIQMAEEHGITREQLQQKMRDSQITQLKTHLQVLVDKGVITQEQADKRVQFMEQQLLKGKFGRGMLGGYLSHYGFKNNKVLQSAE